MIKIITAGVKPAEKLKLLGNLQNALRQRKPNENFGIDRVGGQV
ncbi:hypothetical protein [Rhizobium lentis]|uniref:Uncharacterized protein n=1 Tax=Rhizobium lentis TaxID=1138194 RepID=A0A7W8XKC0_9HYPH|nr:hypothetical protein [Rhizobium lentis]MBB4577240.1 hypothetical protein [Rhizobium lentis]MBB5553803.1 hypothetical protein [Rhizobium lentis]MBB5564364.1 hypothetical protein [Rhizobium lentis]MBB5570836.1 hypothetical protein [Rhizobium lentis]